MLHGRLSLIFIAIFMLLVAVSFGSCGGQPQAARFIPSALDSQAIDASANSAPAALPTLSAFVPADSILEQTEWTADDRGKRVQSRSWWDLQNRRERDDLFGNLANYEAPTTTTGSDPETAAIASSTVWQDGEGLTYSEDWGSLDKNARWTDPDSQDILNIRDGGVKDVVLLGQQHLGATVVDVYRVDLKPQTSEGEPTYLDEVTHALVYVDATSKLRLREEWMVGSPGHAWVVDLLEYRLLPRTAELEARLSTQAVRDLAASRLKAKRDELKALDFPVWGLPEGTAGLTLKGVQVNRSGRAVRVNLEYVASGAAGDMTVMIGTQNWVTNSPPPPRDQALVDSRGEEIAFRMKEAGSGGQPGYDTLVDIFSIETSGQRSVKALAAALVDIR